MATTYPLPTLAPTITAAGITAPSYSDILSSLQATFRRIYGPDAYLEPDSQDGQWIAIQAQAQHDTNQVILMVYNSFSPATAQGVNLSNIVKINHMARALASKSQVNVTITGVAGTLINNGIVADDLGNKWLLPSSVLIPPAGEIIVTADSQDDGAIPAPIGSVTRILTPTGGWQSVTNASASSLGNPVEDDATLRARQEISPALNSETTLSGLLAALRGITGVDYVRIYENDTGTTDGDGLPEHSIGVVIEGGDATEIATTIMQKKGPGVATYGSTEIDITDISGALRPIYFSTPTQVPIKVAVAITAGTNYTSLIGDRLKQEITDYINNSLTIGDDVVPVRLYVPAMLDGDPDSNTYVITSLTAALYPSGTLATTPITIAFNAKATCDVAHITLTVS